MVAKIIHYCAYDKATNQPTPAITNTPSWNSTISKQQCHLSTSYPPYYFTYL